MNGSLSQSLATLDINATSDVTAGVTDTCSELSQTNQIYKEYILSLQVIQRHPEALRDFKNELLNKRSKLSEERNVTSSVYQTKDAAGLELDRLRQNEIYRSFL